jgi:linoleoyl-CoA desaturase
MQQVHFAADSGFHAALKQRVAHYFVSSGKRQTANAAMVAKTTFWLALAVALWLTAVFAQHRGLAWLSACALGFTLSAIGFNISHDAIHGAYSTRPWINRALSWTFPLMGASTFTWRTAHNVIHHTYTNVAGVDFDLDPGPWLRFRPGAGTRWFHRYQHIYCWPLYALITIVWLVQKDFLQLLEHKERTGKRAPPIAIASVFVAKAAHVTTFIVLPLLLSRWSALEVLIGYLSMHAVSGVALSIVFQLAHVVEGPAMPDPRIVDDSWAAHELRTTANFAPRSKIVTFITGGLNHQIEHHLFPRVCHVHYPALARIVSETANEFGLPYHVHETFFDAVRSHARTLKRIGAEASPQSDGQLAKGLG